MDEKPNGRLSRPRWMVLVTVVLSVMGLAVAGVSYTSYVDGEREAAERESDRRWCDLLVTLDEASVPPTTELGHRVAAAIHRLRVDIGC